MLKFTNVPLESCVNFVSETAKIVKPFNWFKTCFAAHAFGRLLSGRSVDRTKKSGGNRERGGGGGRGRVLGAWHDPIQGKIALKQLFFEGTSNHLSRRLQTRQHEKKQSNSSWPLLTISFPIKLRNFAKHVNKQSKAKQGKHVSQIAVVHKIIRSIFNT